MIGRVAALLVLLLTLAPFPLAGIWALSAYREGEAERQDLLDRFDKLRGIASYRPAADADKATTDFTPFLLGEGTTAILSAGLQARLRDMAAQQGVEISQMSDLETAQASDFSQIGIRVEMTGPQQGVHAVMQSIDRAVPWLFASNVTIRSGFADGADAAMEPPLAVALDVTGLANLNAGGGKP